MVDRGYNGNPLLKKSRKNINWTPELIEEYTKCAMDPIYFAERYMKVVNVDLGLITIPLYDFQKEIINNMHTGRAVCTVASRQCGKCFHINSTVKVRNKKTGLIETITVGELYEKAKAKKSPKNEND